MKETDARDFPDQSTGVACCTLNLDATDHLTGIFGTGASYQRVDTVPWVPVRDPEAWFVWEDEMAKTAAS
jgi:hypothetical protein